MSSLPRLNLAALLLATGASVGVPLSGCGGEVGVGARRCHAGPVGGSGGKWDETFLKQARAWPLAERVGRGRGIAGLCERLARWEVAALLSP